jgi:hypothetical protein
VAGEDGYAVTGGRVPDANGLVVRGGDLAGLLASPSRDTKTITHNPGHFMVELHGPDVVQVTGEGEETAPVLRSDIPYFDFVVIATRREESPGGMEMDGSDGTLVLVEAIDEDAHAVVPELDRPIVQRGGQQRLCGMESQTWTEIRDKFWNKNRTVDRPFTRFDFDSNFVNITDIFVGCFEAEETIRVQKVVNHHVLSNIWEFPNPNASFVFCSCAQRLPLPRSLPRFVIHSRRPTLSADTQPILAPA